MKKALSSENLLNQLSQGKVYRRKELLAHSRSVDRDLKRLEKEGSLQKVGTGLYLYPKNCRWGFLPAEAKELARSFLKTSDFLLISNNHYNALGLGMTQLWNEVRVYNKRRHQKIDLGGLQFDFQVLFNGYPSELTVEFLLVDLLNNISQCGESPVKMKEKISKSLDKVDKTLLFDLSQEHGKLATKRYFQQLLGS